MRDKIKKDYDKYWGSVAKRKEYLADNSDSKENSKEEFKDRVSEFEDEKSPELWDCSYSSSTDTEDDEGEDDEEAFDIVDEAVHEVQVGEEKTTRKYLLNVDNRYAHKYTLDKLHRELLVIQDSKQSKKRSFSC